MRLAKYGRWEAWRAEKRYFVRDSKTGVEFNCNCASHAVKKAQDYARDDETLRRVRLNDYFDNYSDADPGL